VGKIHSVVGVAAMCVLALGACASSEVSVDDLRHAAHAAGNACPVDFDVPAALRAGGVDRPARPDGADVEVSDTETPAPDPTAAQLEQGLTPLEATAGLLIECHYQVDESKLTVRVVATRIPASLNILVPTISRTAKMTSAELSTFVATPPDPGDTRLTPDNEVALNRLRVDGDGDATLMVSADPALPGLSGEALRSATAALADQVNP